MIATGCEGDTSLYEDDRSFKPRCLTLKITAFLPIFTRPAMKILK